MEMITILTICLILEMFFFCSCINASAKKNLSILMGILISILPIVNIIYCLYCIKMGYIKVYGYRDFLNDLKKLK